MRVMVQPEINIEVNLPAAWNTRLYMFGNGGWAGEPFDSAGRAANRARGLTAGFVTAATDTGHSAANEPGASFALNRQKLLDYGFRSLHVTAEMAKLLARTYYGAGPTKSYYEGCSQGGRQGLTLAQRFPNDFDGIVAGSPAVYQTATHLSRAYWMQGMNANPFPAAKLGLLANKVYEQCDAKDGLKDGLIDDPRRCDFKPARDLPHCAAGADQADCFTADQIKALDRIYGDVISQGKRFFPGMAGGRGDRRSERAERLDRTGDQRAERPRSVDIVRAQFSAVRAAGSEGRRGGQRSGTRLSAVRHRQVSGPGGGIAPDHRRDGYGSFGIPAAGRQTADVFRMGRSAVESPDGRGVLRAGDGEDGRFDGRLFPVCSWSRECSIAEAGWGRARSMRRRPW